MQDDWEEGAGGPAPEDVEETGALAEEDKPTRPEVEDPESDRPPPLVGAEESDDLDDLLDNPNLPGFTVEPN